MRTHHLDRDACPTCERPLDSHGSLEGHDRPEAGDQTICIGCGAIAIYDFKLRLRYPTDEELREALRDPQVRRLRAIQRKLKP